MKDFSELVSNERVRQEIKWGEQNHCQELCYAILGEEYGEVGTAILVSIFGTAKADDKDIGKELVHVAAVAKAMYESGVRNGWVQE